MADASMRSRRLLPAILRLYPLLVVVILWDLVARSGTVSRRLMPDVGSIIDALVTDLGNGELLFQTAITLQRALSGFGLAIVFGIVIGALMARVRWFEWMIEPIFSFGYPIPKIALYPIFLFVFGLDSGSKIALIFLECLFPIAVNTYYGIRSVDTKLVWSAQNMGANRMQIFWRVLFPAAAPSIFAGIRVALPLSLIVVIITEMIGESRGLGYYISYASASFTSENAYAGVLVVAAIGFVLDRLMVFMRKRLIFWEGRSSLKSN